MIFVRFIRVVEGADPYNKISIISYLFYINYYLLICAGRRGRRPLLNAFPKSIRKAFRQGNGGTEGDG